MPPSNWPKIVRVDDLTLSKRLVEIEAVGGNSGFAGALDA